MERDASGEGESYAANSAGNTVQVAADGVSGRIALANGVQSSGSFTMELVLDEETIFASEPLAPGESLEEITLTKPLEPGEYEAMLVISKYTAEGEYIYGQRQPVTITVAAE